MFECGYHIPELEKSEYWKANAEDLIDGWASLYLQNFADGQTTVLAVQPTITGIYSLERIE